MGRHTHPLKLLYLARIDCPRHCEATLKIVHAAGRVTFAELKRRGGARDQPRAAMSGNKLLSVCESSAAWDRSACTAYVAGVVDLLEQLAFRDGVKCWAAIPQQVTIDQMADIVLKYLREHPENRHYAGASNVGLAIEGTFPCL